MNLSRNKLSKIANTKYQSRKNRPSKKKNAGASKIRTKFTKKRKIGGKGKNLRKNTMKQKIQFNKKGGLPENPAAGTQTQTDPAIESKIESEQEEAKAKAEEEAKAKAEAEAEAEAKAKAESEAKAKAESEAKAKAEAEAKAKAEAEAKAREEELEGQQQPTENPQGDFTVTMKLGINTQNELYVKEVTPSLDNGNPNSGNSTIASLATGKSVNETDFEQLPMKDMLKQIFDMLQKQQQQ